MGNVVVSLFQTRSHQGMTGLCGQRSQACLHRGNIVRFGELVIASVLGVDAETVAVTQEAILHQAGATAFIGNGTPALERGGVTRRTPSTKGRSPNLVTGLFVACGALAV